VIAWLAAAVAAEPPLPEPPAAGDDLSWYVIPNVSIDTDDGFGAGGRAEVAWKDDAHDPYRLSLVAQGYAAVSGFQHHRFRVDALGLGPAGLSRLTLHLAWRQWLTDGYWGIGNGSAREVAFARSFDRDDPAFHRYQYSLVQPFAHLTWRRQWSAGSPTELYVAFNPKYSVVETYPGSLLAEDRPYGLEGGLTAQVFAGVLHDTRAPEVAPRRGHLLEAGARLAPGLTGEAGTFAGGLVSARGFLGGDRAVVAGRVMAEWLVGAIPFYEMVHWGGAIPIAGVGGPETLRGVLFGRFRAPGKAVANGEVRVRTLTIRPRGATLDLEVAPYLDLATVWGAETPVAAPLPVHPAAGGGLRVVFDRTFVGRVDTGVGLDPVLRPDGRVEQRPAWGFYLTFDHAF
jgi:hypothetical protein